MTETKADIEVLQRLFAVIEARRGEDGTTSYTADLLSKGPVGIAKKLGEEAVETVLAAATDDTEQIIYESADLLYHLLVLWASAGISPNDVWAELARREGTSGIAEKASRKKDA
jgi:phosphoribosyl-ATP pyrophosphohydrolase